MKSLYISKITRYFILDSLWLMQTKYSDFIRKDWKEFFNTPIHLKITIKDIENELTAMIKDGLILIKEGWCFLSPKGANIWEDLFHVNWENFYLIEYEFKGDDFDDEILNFYCYSNKVLENFKSQIYIKDIINEERLNKWQLCYWKELDTGFFLSQKITEHNKLTSSLLSNWEYNLLDWKYDLSDLLTPLN